MHKSNVLPVWLAFSLLFPAVSFAQFAPNYRQALISQSLDMIEAQDRQVPQADIFSQRNAAKPPEDEIVLEEETPSNGDKQFFFGNAATNVSVGLGTGRINGSTMYHISFDEPYAVGGHGESELEWPLDSALWGVSAAFHYKRFEERALAHDRVRVGLTWLMGSDNNAGDMRDSDWIENDVGFIDASDDNVLNGSSAWASNHDGLDIYSQQPAKLDNATVFDINYVYNLLIKKNWAIGPVIGYHYQHFQYSIYSVNQTGFGPYGPGPYDVSAQDDSGRKWGEYEVTYHVPYIGLNSELNLSRRLSLLLNFGYSDWVTVKDKDTHLYPTADEFYGFNIDKVSLGRCDGRAYLFSGQGNWRFSDRWSLNLGANYVSIKARGRMPQETYIDGFLSDRYDQIDEKIKSQYWLLNASFQHRF